MMKMQVLKPFTSHIIFKNIQDYYRIIYKIILISYSNLTESDLSNIM
jgi:hypothetical protein